MRSKRDRWFSGWCRAMEGWTPDRYPTTHRAEQEGTDAERKGCEAFWQHRPDLQQYWSVSMTNQINPHKEK